MTFHTTTTVNNNNNRIKVSAYPNDFMKGVQRFIHETIIMLHSYWVIVFGTKI